MLAALETSEEVDQLLADGNGATQKRSPGRAPTQESPAPKKPPRTAFLLRLTAQGFRGIGPKATLDLTPGLTLVVGRNGSGKSSFAEGLELLLTGETYRWSQRSKVWRDGWRNFRHPKAALSQKGWGLEDSDGGVVYLARDDQRTRQREPIGGAANRDPPRCAQRSDDWLRRPRGLHTGQRPGSSRGARRGSQSIGSCSSDPRAGEPPRLQGRRRFGKRPSTPRSGPRARGGRAALRRDLERLEDVLEAIERIQDQTKGGRAVFDSEPLVQVWVVHHLEIVGEACRALSAELQKRHPEVPWGAIIGMRNILVHDYFGINLDEVWTAVERDLPTLRDQVLAILESEQGASG